MLVKIMNLVLRLFGRHVCDWKYFDLQYVRGLPYDAKHYIQRVCAVCDEKEEWIPILDQEGGCCGGEWRECLK